MLRQRPRVDLSTHHSLRFIRPSLGPDSQAWGQGLASARTFNFGKSPLLSISPAMVLRLHGYGAWIESDGKPLEEYAVEVKGDTISCYVCSEEGKVKLEPRVPV